MTGDPIRKKTLKYLELLANRWKHSIMKEGWSSFIDSSQHSPPDVIDCVIGVYCMERVGIPHDVKAELLEFLQKKMYSAKDYLGWDPVSSLKNLKPIIS